MNQLISILIPSYNHSKYIGETLNSVIEDNYPNKEIVIIDDGSTDNSVEIINEWIKNNPEHSVNFSVRSNRGITYTLNELVSLAKGDFLVLLASDDVLINNTLKERREFLVESGKKVLVSDAQVIDSEGNVINDSMLFNFHKANKSKYFNSEDILDEIVFNFSISGAVVMINKNIFSSIGKYPEDLKAEDFYFYISVAAKRELLFYDRIVSKYRQHSSNTSGINPELTIAIIKTYKRLFFKIPGFTRKLKVLKRLIGIYCYKFKNFKND